MVLPLGQPVHQRPRLGLGGGGQVRRAVEVDEHDRAAAPHHAPGRHGRVDAARQQRRHGAARAHREPAGPGLPVEVDERLVRQHLDRDRQRGPLEVDAGAGAPEDEGPELTVELDRRQRVRLERSPRRDPERLELAPLDQPGDHRLHGLDRRAHPVGEGEVGHAGDARDPREHRLGLLVTLEVEEEAAGAADDRDRRQIGGGPREVPGELAEEARAVAALQADLVDVDDDAGAEPGHAPTRP